MIQLTKIVIIGAGSGFGGRLSIDIMSREVLQDATICLCDLHAGRLEKVRSYVQRTAERYNLPTKIVPAPTAENCYRVRISWSRPSL